MDFPYFDLLLGHMSFLVYSAPTFQRPEFICSVIAHISQPYNTIGLITVEYIFSFFCVVYYVGNLNFLCATQQHKQKWFLLGSIYI